jgi:hypothetical protein
MIVAISTLLLPCIAATAFESLPAKWKHSLRSTHLKGYKPGEHLIVSDISTGISPDSTVHHSLEIKVTSWNQKFSTNRKAMDKNDQTFSVTLKPMDNPKEMIAVFEHCVYENGELKLKFSGQTILTRTN